MILGLYLVGRAMAWVFMLMLMAFMLIVWLIWQLLRMVGFLLVQPETWAPRHEQEARRRQRSPNTHTGPRNERLFYSSRR